MAAPKFMRLVGGRLAEIAGLEVSAGAGDAEKIVATDPTGRLDLSLMPSGVGPDTETLVASETIASGALVSQHNVAGVTKIRNADASVQTKEADGFVLVGGAAAASLVVYYAGRNTAVSGLTPASELYLSATTPGGVTDTPPTGAGKICQRVGEAVTASVMNFEKQLPIDLAA